MEIHSANLSAGPNPAAFSQKRNSYIVPSTYVKKFTPDEFRNFKLAFKVFDKDGNGSIDADELSAALRNLGENVTDSQVKTYIAEVDADKSGTIEFTEFLSIVDKHRSGQASSLADAVQKTVVKVEGLQGAQHSYSTEECAAFAEHINNCLRSDSDLKCLPINPNSTQLFEAVKDGILLCKLINAAVPDTVDVRALNIQRGSGPLSVYHRTENQNLAINAAKGIGCVVVNLGSQDLIEGNPILTLGLVWQIVKIQLLSKITLKQHPELVRLLEDGEEMGDLMKLSPEEILLRWMNFHLAAANHNKRVKNFGSDLADSQVYTVILHQIAPEMCDLSALSLQDLHKRARTVIDSAKKLGAETFIQPGDIVNGNKKLNLAFVAQLFNTCPGLTITEEEIYEMAGLLDEDEGDSREERIFRMWINSLNIPDGYVNNLFLDVTDGLIILKVMDRVEPGIVSWKTVNLNPVNRFKRVENGNYCVVLGKKMKFTMVNIGGLDIVDCNKKLILAIIWQLMRLHSIKILESLSKDGSQISDQKIVDWANQKVKAAGKQSKMTSFKDPSLANGVFLMDLVYAIEPRAVNWDLVTTGETEEDRKNNAKYAISVARKIGATVFLTYDDIVEVKSKMILTFVASLMATCMNSK